jgi:hypothetical protein
MPRLTSILAFSLCLGAVASAQTDSCSCPTSKTALFKDFGGSANPLRWKFEVYENGKLTCYVKHVENGSTGDVTDVFWEVANYERDVMAARSADPTCVNYPGEAKATPVPGPLYYNVSLSQSYPTTVKPPDAGWLSKTAQAASPTEVGPPLRADFVLGTRNKDGQLGRTHVTIQSSAFYNGEVSTFNFDISNNGPDPVGIFMNIPATPQMYKDVPAAEKPFFLEAKKQVVFKTSVSAKPEFGPSTVVFYGGDGKQVALETAGFYVPSIGRPLRSDEQLWGSRRR